MTLIQKEAAYVIEDEMLLVKSMLESANQKLNMLRFNIISADYELDHSIVEVMLLYIDILRIRRGQTPIYKMAFMRRSLRSTMVYQVLSQGFELDLSFIFSILESRASELFGFFYRFDTVESVTLWQENMHMSSNNPFCYIIFILRYTNSTKLNGHNEYRRVLEHLIAFIEVRHVYFNMIQTNIFDGVADILRASEVAWIRFRTGWRRFQMSTTFLTAASRLFIVFDRNNQVIGNVNVWQTVDSILNALADVFYGMGPHMFDAAQVLRASVVFRPYHNLIYEYLMLR